MVKGMKKDTPVVPYNNSIHERFDGNSNKRSLCVKLPGIYF